MSVYFYLLFCEVDQICTFFLNHGHFTYCTSKPTPQFSLNQLNKLTKNPYSNKTKTKHINNEN